MKAAEVLSLLNICRQTLYRYKKAGIIKVRKLRNGFYDYNDYDVYRLLNTGGERKTYLYARISTPKQKPDLKNQIELLKGWAMQNGYPVHGIFTDVASGISF